MGKMSFTELQEEIYTEELKKIEKESNDYWVCFTDFDPIDCNL